MGARRTPRRFGMLASDFTQCGYLHMKNPIPRHIPMIPALEKCAWNARDLRNATIIFSEIQDLRVFGLDTYHTLIAGQTIGMILR